MAVEDDDDLAIFFDADDFGVVATITPTTGDPISVSGIYDEPTIERGAQHENQFNKSQHIVGQSPAFRAPTALLSSVKAGARFQATVRGVAKDLSVYAVKPTGTGDTFLVLKRNVP